VLDGELVAEKYNALNDTTKVVYNYKEGDYFGELALLHDISRQASVKALSPVRVVYLDRESFKRIFGSMEEILKRNE
jgi:cAMP-dependent protein kinase regulator